MVSGLIGVPLGSFLAQHFRRTHQRTDPIICAWGLLISAPLVYLALILARFAEGWCYFIICLAEISLNLCWSIVADILLVSTFVRNEQTLRMNRPSTKTEDLFEKTKTYKSIWQIDNNIQNDRWKCSTPEPHSLFSSVVVPPFNDTKPY